MPERVLLDPTSQKNRLQLRHQQNHATEKGTWSFKKIKDWVSLGTRKFNAKRNRAGQSLYHWGDSLPLDDLWSVLSDDHMLVTPKQLFQDLRYPLNLNHLNPFLSTQRPQTHASSLPSSIDQKTNYFSNLLPSSNHFQQVHTFSVHSV